MTASLAADAALTVGAVLCSILQLATYRMSDRAAPLLLAGRAALMSGWTAAAVRSVYLMTEHGDLGLTPTMQLVMALLEIGTVLVTVHWISGCQQDRE